MFSVFGKQAETPFGQKPEARGLRRIFAALFREREILIRSDGQVGFLRLGPRVQAAAFALILGGTIWALTAVPVTVTQSVTNAANSAQILEAKLAYEDLVMEIAEYQQAVTRARAALRESRTTLAAQIAAAEEAESRFATIGESMAGPRAAIEQSRLAMQGHLGQINETLAAVANDGEELDSMVAKVRADLADSEDGTTLVARARARLHERAEGLEIKLASVVETNQATESKNAELTSNLKMTTAERDGLLDQRGTLRAEIAALESELSTLEKNRSRITSENSELTARLEASIGETEDLAEERNGLQEQIAALDSELQLNRVEADTLKGDLKVVAHSLQIAAGDATEVDNTRLALRSQIDGLLAELSNQQAAGEVVLQRATERAANSVKEIEKIVAMSGLSVETLLSRAQLDQLGQGGPFIAAAGELPADQELAKNMLALESKMSRWEALKDILRAMPITLPVDYYHLTSLFGPRHDPVNNKRSRHNGLDMAGWLKSSVWAAAPGTVIYSGWKGRYGIVVDIDHGYGIRTRYAHLNKTLVEVGEVVGHRQRIALLGSTGRSTGPHLHYEVRFDGKPLNPMNFIKAGRYVFKN